MADETKTSTKYYAWSNFELERDGFGRAAKRVVPGDEVSADKLGVSKADFDAMIEAGSVRTMKFPDDMPATWTQSPIEWLKEKARLAGEEALAGVTPMEPAVSDEMGVTST